MYRMSGYRGIGRRAYVALASAVLLAALASPGGGAVAASQAVAVQQDPTVQMDLQRQLNRLYSTGYKYYEIQDYANAIPAFKRYTELDSTNTRAWYFLATCYTMTERWEEARDAYQTILRLQPDDVDALQSLAFTYNELGETELVVKTYERIVELVPGEPEYRDYLLSLYRRDQNGEGMIRLLEEQAKRAPDDPNVHRQLAELYRRRGDVQAQVLALEEAVKNEPDNPQNLIRLGRLYSADLNQPCEAARIYGLLTQVSPDDPVAWRLLGRFRKRCGETAVAVDAFRRAIELNPEEVRVYSEMALALSDLGRHEEAVTWVEQAVRRGPEDGYAYVTWGDILRDQGMAAADSTGNVPYEAKIVLESAIEKYRKALDTGGISAEIVRYAEQQVETLEPFRRTKAEIFMHRARAQRPPPPPPF